MQAAFIASFLSATTTSALRMLKPGLRPKHTELCDDCRFVWVMFTATSRERVLSGLPRAKAERITLGRRPIEESAAGKYEAVKAALAAKQGVRRIPRESQTGVGTVVRIKAELADVS
jgi:hypothetical protein